MQNTKFCAIKRHANIWQLPSNKIAWRIQNINTVLVLVFALITIAGQNNPILLVQRVLSQMSQLFKNNPFCKIPWLYWALKTVFGFCSDLLVAAIGAVWVEWAGSASLGVVGGIEADKVTRGCADERWVCEAGQHVEGGGQHRRVSGYPQWPFDWSFLLDLFPRRDLIV